MELDWPFDESALNELTGDELAGSASNNT
jgi:hypothetical protein